MLSGLKFIPRDQIEKAQDEDLGDSRRERKSSVKKKEKGRGKKKSSRYGSSDEDDLERIAKGSRKKKKWYSSDEYSSYSTENESQSCSDKDGKKGWNRKREMKRYDDGSEDEARDRSKKKLRNRRNNYSSEDHSLSNSEDEDKDGYTGRKDKHRKRSKRHGRKKRSERGGEIELMGDDLTDDGSGSHPLDNSNNIVRKEMGLEWMLRPKDSLERKPAMTSDQPEEPQAEEMKKENPPRELNPYLKNNGTGYPEPADGTKAGRNQLLSSAVVGDGGASWRLKALKRSQEQAARDGRAVEEVVQERWGSLGQLAVSVASRTAAPSRAHLHAINNRKKGLTEEQQKVADDQDEKNIGRESLQNMSRRHPNMKVPKLRDSLSWGKRKSQIMSSTDSGIISTTDPSQHEADHRRRDLSHRPLNGGHRRNNRRSHTRVRHRATRRVPFSLLQPHRVARSRLLRDSVPRLMLVLSQQHLHALKSRSRTDLQSLSPRRHGRTEKPLFASEDSDLEV
ncbi:uncharacterized protein LOC130761015 [Actinidia eriantha]|uniref:uncharacterized protein LOC130761015 n=1 Tax=Actinidia eriantha TaxID=165200 RepID=UPI00258311D5|nr:uncharacterized protein LOC130761015 [Actinidia eriantha]